VKIKFISILILFLSGSLYAFDGLFVSLGGEANGNTREGAAAGGAFSIGFDINSSFSFGMKKSFSYDFKNFTTIEDTGFFRYYPIKTIPVFLQAELGIITYFEEGQSSTAISAGLAAGYRFIVFKNLYIEPVVRGGYPFIWSGGLSVGILFARDSRRDAEVRRTREEE